VKRIPLIYILAASHSGSTLLAMLLGSHPQICTVGELKASSFDDIDRYICSCQRRIRECSFWMGISEDMALKGFSFDITHAGTDIRSGATLYVQWCLKFLHRGPFLEGIRDAALALSVSWRSQLRRVRQVNVALMECLCHRTGKAIIVDSSKIGLRLKYLLLDPTLDVRVIRLVRDGRAVALTYMNPVEFADARAPNLRGGGTGGDREFERLSMEKAAHEWRRSNEEAEAISRRLDRSKWIEVHYEALCTEPDRTLHQLFDFIGVDSVVGSRTFRSIEHHMIGNGMRLDSTPEIKLDERWREVLSPSDLEIFDPIAGKLNRQLGYE
jgi:hypothetical protein